MILDTMYISMMNKVPDVIVVIIMKYADIDENTFTRKPTYD